MARATVNTAHTVTIREAKILVMDILKAGLVPFLGSSPGIGKSDMSRQIAKEFNLKFVDERLSSADPTDLNGFPMILNPGADRVKAGYIPMETFPIVGDPVPKGYNGWLLCLDEFNSAPLAVQAAAYKVILDKQVGKHKLHKQVATICAGNLVGDKAIVNRLSTAMQSRLIHYHIICCPKAWMIWANKHDIDHRVKSFIKFKPELLHDFDPDHTDKTFPCPRTWEFMSKIIKTWKDIPQSKMPTLAGTVGGGAAMVFFSYCQIFEEIPTIEDIIANPTGVSFGRDPSMEHAIAGLVGQYMTPSNANKLVEFITRLGIEFQVTTLRSAIARDPLVKKETNVGKWINTNAMELMDD